MMDQKGYKKLASGGAGSHGVDYQINLLVLFLLEAYDRGEEFRLSTENEDGGKLDDVILETNHMSILLQAKHKTDPKDKKNFITYDDIFPKGKNKDEFNLYKYMKSFSKIKDNFSNINALILCTNTNVTTNKKDNIKKYTNLEMMDEEHIFYFLDKKCYYTFTENCKDLLLTENENLVEEEVNIFLEQMQLVCIDDQNIYDRIELLTKKNNLFNASVDVKQSIDFVRENIKAWFTNKKGTYITLQYIEGLKSQYFINNLTKLDVEFRTANGPIGKTGYLCYIIPKRETVHLHLLRIYQQIKEDKVLIVDPYCQLDIKGKIIAAFTIDEFVYLIVPIFTEEYDALSTLVKHVIKRTCAKPYKKVIFITDQHNISEKLAKDFKMQMDTITQTVEYSSFSDRTQAEICSKMITFQTKNCSLKEILCAQIGELNKILDESTILKLINKNENIIINNRYNERDINFYISRTIIYDKSEQSELTLEEKESAVPEKAQYSNQCRLSESDLCDFILKEHHIKTILMTDSPGTGKSSVLSNLQKMLNNRSTYWIVKVNLNEHTETFKNCLRNKINSNEVLALLVRKKNSVMDEFETNIFNLPKKVILMMDALDEISPNYSRLILDLIIYCESLENMRKIIVTTRSHCKKDIVKSVKSFAYSLNPFSDEDQRMFLCNYWTTNLKLTSDIEVSKCREFVNILKSKLTESINDKFKFVGIPLQTQIIAETYQKSCSKFITSNIFETEFHRKLNVAILYETFIDEKKNIYIEEKNDASGKIDVEDTLHEKFDVALKELIRDALKVVFNENEYEHFKILQRNSYDNKDVPVSEQIILRIGIMHKYDDTLHFIHRTFAEYLAAKYICNILKEGDAEYGFLDFLVRDILLYIGRGTLWNFMDCILQNQKVSEGILDICGKITENIEWTYLNNIIYLSKGSHFNLLKTMLQKCNHCKHVLRLTFSAVDYSPGRCENEYDILKFSLSDFSMFKLLVGKGDNIYKFYDNKKSLLHLAVENNSREVVDFLIQNGLNVNIRDGYGNTPLHYAAKTNIVNTVTTLVSNKAQISTKNHDKESPLHFAVTSNSIDILPILVQQKNCIDDKDKCKRTPILAACNSGSYGCVKYLFEVGADIRATDIKGLNILHYFSKSNNVSNYEPDILTVVMQILEQNAIDINSLCSAGNAALHYAVITEKVVVTKLLLDAGADIEIRNNGGATSLLLACSVGSFDCAAHLIASGADITAIDNEGCNAWHYLSNCFKVNYNEESYNKVVEHLYEKCVDVNRICRRGMTALHNAVKKKFVYSTNNRNLRMTKLLLEAGAKKEIKNKKGITPFLWAYLNGSFDCAAHLIKNGADITVTDNLGRNIVYCLLRGGYVHHQHESNREILEKIFKTDLINHNIMYKGMTYLHFAAQYENKVLTTLLLEAGAEIDIKNTEGETPLLLACLHESLDCAAILIENGADVTATDKRGYNTLLWLLINSRMYQDISEKIMLKNIINVNTTFEGMTVLHYAVKAANLKISKLLLEAGAEKEAKDNRGTTPFLLACLSGAFDCAEYLINAGANITATNNEGLNVLHSLSLTNIRLVHKYKNYKQLVEKVLEQKCINVNSVCKSKETALHYAVKSKNVIMVKLLLSAGADVEIRNTGGETSFLKACLNQSCDCVSYLIDSGVDVKAVDNKGRNALHCLSSRSDNSDVTQEVCRKIVDKLLEHLDINIVYNGKTSLHCAVENKNKVMTKLLVDSGANMEIMNKNGETALLVACYAQSHECATYLINHGADGTATDNSNRNILNYLLSYDNTKDWKVASNVINIEQVMGKILEKNIINVNTVYNGITYLHYAVQAHNLLLTKLLLHAQADMEIEDKNGATPFLLACSSNSLDCAEFLIENGARVDVTDNNGFNSLYYLSRSPFINSKHSLSKEILENLSEKNATLDVNNTICAGNTALHYAVSFKNILMTKLLIDVGADKEIKNNYGETPLLLACSKESLDCAAYLIDKGADATVIDKKGCDCFYYLLKNNLADNSCREIVEKILEKKIINIDYIYKGTSALHYAVRDNNLLVTKLLLDSGANKEVKNSDGETPLLVACCYGSLDCVEYLLDNGADVTVSTSKNLNVLHAFFYNNHSDVDPYSYKKILEKIFEKTIIDVNALHEGVSLLLHYVVQKKNVLMTKLLLNAGADKEIKNERGRTPLLVACICGSFECLDQLINNSAEITAIDNKGHNALHLLANNHNLKRNFCRRSVERILKANAIDINSVCNTGKAAVHYACQARNFDMLEILITAGANTEIRNTNGATPFLVACRLGSLECIKFLMDNEVDVAAIDNDGCTALHCLSKNHHYKKIFYSELVDMVLCRQLVDINSICNLGETALHYAVKTRNLIMIKLLLGASANKEIKNNKGMTILLQVCSLGLLDCVEYLIDGGADAMATNNEGRNSLHLLMLNYVDHKPEGYRILVEKICKNNPAIINSVCAGMTPLHYSVKNRSLIKTKFLLDAKANKEIENNEGETPLLLACSRRSLECAAYLIDNGADITGTDNEGRNVLHCLSGYYNVEIRFNIYGQLLKKILDINAINVNDVCDKKMTALHYAMKTKNLTATKLLLHAGANKEARNAEGETALLFACSRGSFDCAAYLIDNEADVTVTNNEGRNALHWLSINKYEVGYKQEGTKNVCKKILVKNSVLINSLFHGKTALFYAKQNKNFPMRDLLLQAGAEDDLDNTHIAH